MFVISRRYLTLKLPHQSLRFKTSKVFDLKIFFFNFAQCLEMKRINVLRDMTLFNFIC